jgi:hypothetical protein
MSTPDDNKCPHCGWTVKNPCTTITQISRCPNRLSNFMRRLRKLFKS